MSEKVRNICDVENTLEPELCLKVWSAKLLLEDVLKETRYNNRDTMNLKNVVIPELEFIIKANSSSK